MKRRWNSVSTADVDLDAVEGQSEGGDADGMEYEMEGAEARPSKRVARRA